MLALNPKSISIDMKNASLSVFGSYFVTGNYECLFDSATTVANRISSTLLVCPIPTVSQAINVLVRISYNTTIVYSSNTLPFLFYGTTTFLTSLNHGLDCITNHNCSSCIDTLQPDCVWCFDSATCGYQATSSCNQLQNSCPSISSITPRSSLAGQHTTVTIYGNHTPLPQIINAIPQVAHSSTALNIRVTMETKSSCLLPGSVPLLSAAMPLFSMQEP
jgi:hypothetical protein